MVVKYEDHSLKIPVVALGKSKCRLSDLTRPDRPFAAIRPMPLQDDTAASAVSDTSHQVSSTHQTRRAIVDDGDDD